MSTAATDRIESRKRPLLAVLLQILCLTGGLGYAYLGQWAKAGLTLALVLLLQGGNVVASGNEWKLISMILGPLVMTIQALTAYDAWLLARHLRGGGSVGRRESRAPVLRSLPGFA